MNTKTEHKVSDMIATIREGYDPDLLVENITESNLLEQSSNGNLMDTYMYYLVNGSTEGVGVMRTALRHIPPVFEMSRAAGSFLKQLKRELAEEWDTGAHKADFKTRKGFIDKLLTKASTYAKLVPKP